MMFTMLNDEGKRLWGDVFLDGNVPVQSIAQTFAKLGGAGTQPIYKVDWPSLTPSQQEAVIKKLSLCFQDKPEVIRATIEKDGFIPLRASLTCGAAADMRHLL
jgi:hypothetical protein